MKSELKNLKRVVAKAAHLERAQAFVEWAKEELGLEGCAKESMEEAIRLGDVVSIAASPKEPLYLKDAWLKEGATVLLTSPIEADDAFWLNNKLVFDNTKMHEAYYDEAMKLGDITKACNGWGRMYALMEQGRLAGLEQEISLGDVVVEPSYGRKTPQEKQIFVTSGQVLFDIAWGYELYREALKKGIGVKLNLWQEPYWT